MIEKRIVHVINGLGKGGAETMLFNLIKYGSPGFKHIVISLGLNDDYYKNKLIAEGADVIALNFKKHLIKTLKIVKKNTSSDCIICCWMYFSNIIGYFFRGKKDNKIIWNIRHSDLSKKNNSFLTRISIFLGKRISKRINTIAYNGLKSMNNHLSMGFKAKNSIVLNNGCDTNIYSHNKGSRAKLELDLKIGTNKIILLSVSRNAVIKDNPNFIKMLSILVQKGLPVVGIMCGSGLDEENEFLLNNIKDTNLKLNSDVFLLGFRDDVQFLMSACDAFVLHSKGEAFPNTIIQAMACETPIVATDVGDVSEIIADKQFIVTPNNPTELANAVQRLLSTTIEEKKRMVSLNKERVIKCYEIRNIVIDYENLF